MQVVPCLGNVFSTKKKHVPIDSFTMLNNGRMRKSITLSLEQLRLDLSFSTDIAAAQFPMF